MYPLGTAATDLQPQTRALNFCSLQDCAKWATESRPTPLKSPYKLPKRVIQSVLRTVPRASLNVRYGSQTRYVRTAHVTVTVHFVRTVVRPVGSPGCFFHSINAHFPFAAPERSKLPASILYLVVSPNRGSLQDNCSLKQHFFHSPYLSSPPKQRRRPDQAVLDIYRSHSDNQVPPLNNYESSTTPSSTTILDIWLLGVGSDNTCFSTTQEHTWWTECIDHDLGETNNFSKWAPQNERQSIPEILDDLGPNLTPLALAHNMVLFIHQIRYQSKQRGPLSSISQEHAFGTPSTSGLVPCPTELNNPSSSSVGDHIYTGIAGVQGDGKVGIRRIKTKMKHKLRVESQARQANRCNTCGLGFTYTKDLDRNQSSSHPCASSTKNPIQISMWKQILAERLPFTTHSDQEGYCGDIPHRSLGSPKRVWRSIWVTLNVAVELNISLWAVVLRTLERIELVLSNSPLFLSLILKHGSHPCPGRIYTPGVTGVVHELQVVSISV
ncbi:uncharacterized protein BDR25DRAFT_354203 [Lindgomyces ingoldianus]|uniref:Uncharacterized protein n=1 Tax=Lindgomyces ingoldianus TaxID=673940 RepID=A0ACB6QXV6_9PLEO|nr:uncharacterized protein BDR25DRAFT_354203 [Lindgomyces ingoldianus]KAF2471705.1 hypothetical protein BDR25DRAFT_354203 [Lindgomyces ingoldianus]